MNSFNLYKDFSEHSKVHQHLSVERINLLYASEIFQDVIRNKLSNVNQLSLSERTKQQGGSSQTSYLQECILKSFWQFSEECIIRECQNKTCSQYFQITGADYRKRFCCHESLLGHQTPIFTSFVKEYKNPTSLMVVGFHLVAGAGFGPATFGLWARRATGLLHPAICCLPLGKLFLNRAYIV